MDYISITNSLVDNFIVAEPTAVAGLESALNCKLLPRDEWPTAERGDQLIDGVLYRTVDGALTDIRLIKPPEPVQPQPDPLTQRVDALEEQNNTIMIALAETIEMVGDMLSK